MSVLLCGGGGTEAIAVALERLRAELTASGASSPRVGVLGQGPKLPNPLVTVALPPVPSTGEVLGLDALLVPEGDAAAQLLALADVVSDLRGLVHRGASFLGIGSGAAIAADAALLGGSEVGGVPVAPASDDAEPEVEIATGLGLIDLTVLPHAAASGRLGVAIAACEAELVDRVIGLDDGLTLAIASGALELLGTGSMWQLTATDAGVLVQTNRAVVE